MVGSDLMGFWPTLLVIDIVVGIFLFAMMGVGRIIWEVIRNKAPKLFYFPLKEEHYDGIPPYPKRAFAIIFLNVAVILNLIAITIYIGKGLKA